MKKKMLLLAALVAATTAFTGCSSDEELAQAPQAPAGEETVSQGFPMRVSIADTRGTDLTKSTLPGFTMYSSMLTPGKANTWQVDGVAFTNNNGTCTKVGSADINFPDKTNDYTFYAVSDPGNIVDLDSDGHKDIPSVTADPVAFSYQVPTAYADQKDLLVATATGNGADGEISLTFDHALAKIKAIKVYANIDKITNSGDKLAYRFRIKGIRLGGLKTAGIYTFGTGWGNLATDDEMEVPLNTDASVYNFSSMSFQPGEKASAITLPLTDDGLYIMPQVAAGALADDGAGYAVENAYAELDAQVFFYSDISNMSGGGAYRVGEDLWSGFDWNEESSDGVGFGKIRVPLKFTAVAGNGYTLVLDISNAIIYENEGKDDGTAVSESVFSGATLIVG